MFQKISKIFNNPSSLFSETSNKTSKIQNSQRTQNSRGVLASLQGVNSRGTTDSNRGSISSITPLLKRLSSNTDSRRTSLDTLSSQSSGRTSTYKNGETSSYELNSETQIVNSEGLYSNQTQQSSSFYPLDGVFDVKDNSNQQNNSTPQSQRKQYTPGAHLDDLFNENDSHPNNNPEFEKLTDRNLESLPKSMQKTLNEFDKWLDQAKARQKSKISSQPSNAKAEKILEELTGLPSMGSGYFFNFQRR